MNRTFSYILTFGLLLLGGVAMGQRTDQQHVSVGGNVFGGGKNADVKGSSTVLVDQNGAIIGTKTGGTLVDETGDVYGGGALAKVNVTDNNGNLSQTPGDTTAVTLRKGTVYGNLYGGGLGVRPTDPDDPSTGTAADVYGPVTVTINGGTVEGSIFGCNNLYGAPQDTVIVNVLKDGENVVLSINNVYGGGNLAAYVAPTATATYPKLHNYPEVNIKHGTVGGSVFGGGYGVSAMVTGNPQVFIGDDNSNHAAIVSGNVYGGGDEAAVTGYTLVTVQNANSQVVQDVYGGGNQADVSGSDTVNILNGTVSRDVYGGGALANVGTNGDDNIVVNVLGGTVSGDVYGGGLGRKAEGQPGETGYVEPIAAAVNGVVTVNIGALTGALDENGFAPSESVFGSATIGGSVFGCNNANGTPKDNVTVNIFQTAHTTTNDADYHHNDSTFAIYQVFGGGNKAHYQPVANKKTTVHVWTCNNTIENLYGGGNAADVGSSNTNSADTVIIDGGRFGWVFGGGNGAGVNNPGANIFGNASVTYHAGDITYLFGGSNEKGNISGVKTVDILSDGQCVYDNRLAELYGGNNLASATGDVTLTMECPEAGSYPCTINYLYGGSRKANIAGNVVLTVKGGIYDYVFGGNNEDGIITGDVTLNLFGGTINEAAFGGNNLGGAINGKITVNMLDQGPCPLIVYNIYGGGNLAAYTPTTVGAYPEVNLIHGTVSQKEITSGGTTTYTDGNVYGGGLGNTATVTSNPVIAVGYNASTMANLVNGLLLSGTSFVESIVSVEGNVYGGGDEAAVSGTTSVTMQEAATTSSFTASSTVGNDIYGGGNLANVSGSTTVDVTGGTVTYDVYGGGALANTGGSTVTLSGGTVQDIYGGGLGNDTHPAAVNGAVQVTVNDGVVRDVFGCNNVKGAPQSTVRVDINNDVTRNVYGGGNQASCGVSPAVYINKGVVGGSVFGGGLGSTATVAGQPSVTIGDLTDGHSSYKAIVTGDVYGGGDMANVKGKTTVLVQKCNTEINGDVYGGGNAAHIQKDDSNTASSGTTSVTVTGGTITGTGHGMVFGGGHGDKDASPAVSANVATSTNVEIKGGTIYQVYGGSNSLGTINGGNTGGINVLVNKASDACDLHINEVYGGGNYAASQAGSIDIECTGSGTNEGINYVYGGANRANVIGPIELTIDEGRIDYVFGGNNNSGSITGDITVNIEKKANPCIWEVGDVFGGGNLAIYDGTPVVNVKNGTVANVYGGGNGDPTSTTQEPGQVAGTNVTIGDATEGYCAVVTGNVYGGGNAAKVAGNTIVTYNDENTSSSVSQLFGGGNQAGVTGTTTVTLTNGTVVTGVYGGCNEKGNVGGNITVNINGGTVGSQANLTSSSHITGNVFGGGYGGYQDASHPGTTTSGDVEVNINGGTIWGDIYGGSAFGDVNATGKKTTVNIMGGTLETSITQGTTASGLSCNIYHGGNVFGGGLGQKAASGVTEYAAKVYGAVTVNIGTGTLDESTPGSDYNEVTGLDGSVIIKGNVYGCNNQNGSPLDNVVVNVFQTEHPEATGGYALHDVFGGGNQADFTVSGKTATVNIYTCANTIERTFSGGNAAATNSVRTMIQGGRIGEVYGGGNGEVSAANVNGTATLDIHGGEIGQSYAGSNQQGTISGGSQVHADDLGPCGGGTNVNEFFCGGNFANYVGNIDATITCNGRMAVDNLYGGCNQALVLGNIKLSVYGGTYKNIYGGSKGRAVGDPLGEFSADVHGDITLNIFGGEVQEAIFGGCNVKGEVKGKIVVNVETIPDNECALEVSEADVYGGGNLAKYDTTPTEIYPTSHPDYPQINIKNATVKNVFGGGLQAEVKGNPQIKIKKGAKILGNVYGGGNMGEVDGSPKVTIDGNDNSANPTGL